MQESSLHADLKKWYQAKGGKLEVAVDGYLIDVVLDGWFLEIQTRNFSALKHKLTSLLENHRVRVIHPIANEKYIIKLGASGDVPITKRKSPKKGRLEELFNEIIHIGGLIPNPNLQIEVLFTQEEEIRRDDGKGSWRRGGISVVDRRLVNVLDNHLINYPIDYLAMLPDALNPTFTNHRLAQVLNIRITLARKMTYSLRSMGLLTIVAKRGNNLIFKPNPKTS